MATCTLIRHGGRRRERDLFLLAAISRTKAVEGIREILKRCVLVILWRRPFADKRLWWWCYNFLIMTISIWRVIRAFKQVSGEHAPASRLRLRSTTKPNGGKNLLDTIEPTFGRSLGRFLAAWCAKREAKLVCLIHA